MLTRAFSQLQLAVLGLVLLTVVTRLPALLHPQPIDDEAMYSVVANEIIDGGRLYADVVDRKPPLLFWTYAAVFETAGKFNWKALHVVTIVWTLGTMAGLYVIGRRLFDRNTGLIAALLYSVFQPWGTSKNLALNGELLMNLPIVWAWAIGFRRSSSPLRLELLAAGGLLCAGFLLKQPAAIAAVPLGIYLLLPSYRISRGVSVRASLTHATMLTAGFFGVLGLAALALQAQGILHDAFYWTFTDHSIPYVFWDRAILHTLAFIGACLPLLIGAALAYRDDRGIWVDKAPERLALLGLLAVSAIGAAAGARFYPHYYIQLIPPLALLAAPHYAQLWSEKTQSHHWLLQPRVTQAWLALTIAAFSIAHWKGLAWQRGPSETGQYLLEHSAPDDRIFVWGQASKIYLDAQRRPACRYITTFPLTGYIFGRSLPGVDTRNRVLPGAWSALQQDFAKHSPVYIVEGYDRDKQYPIHDFPILAKLIADRYQPVARTDDGTIYRRLDAFR
jgi:4-amino-4-deoxy-L-arabinose transferase-like glycosyltransferase